ncbi:mechanosensitive ion channel [Geitlerinema splendidum]|nr:mechanosensitive ion channel [Geitlerinema splendidum]
MQSIMEGFSTVLEQLATWGPRVILGLLLLLVGWVIAKFAQKGISALFHKAGIDKPFEAQLDGLKEIPPENKRPSSLIGLVSFWLIMLFVLVGFFSSMNLEMVATPLQNVLNEVASGIPNFLGAVVLLLVGWLVASLLRGLTIKALNKLEVDTKLKDIGVVSGDVAERKRFSMIAGLFVYGLVILLFAQSALDLAGLTLVASTVQELVNSAVELVPSLMSAAVVFFVAFLMATLARPFIKSILEATGINKHGPHFGLAAEEGEDKKLTLSGVFGNFVYWTILLFAVPAVLDQLGQQALVTPIRGVWDEIFASLPNVGAAALLILVTFFGIKIFAPILRGLLEGLGVDSLLGKIGLVNLQETFDADESRLSPSEIVTRICAVLVSLVVLQEVMNVMGMDYLAAMLQGIVNFFPNIAVAVVILGFAVWLGNIAGDLAKNASSGLDTSTSNLLGMVTRVAVYVFGGTMALTQLGIGGQVVEHSVLILVGGASLAIAISFGLGARPSVERYLERKLEKSQKPAKS